MVVITLQSRLDSEVLHTPSHNMLNTYRILSSHDTTRTERNAKDALEAARGTLLKQAQDEADIHVHPPPESGVVTLLAPRRLHKWGFNLPRFLRPQYYYTLDHPIKHNITRHGYIGL